MVYSLGGNSGDSSRIKISGWFCNKYIFKNKLLWLKSKIIIQQTYFSSIAGLIKLNSSTFSFNVGKSTGLVIKTKLSF